MSFQEIDNSHLAAEIWLYRIIYKQDNTISSKVVRITIAFILKINDDIILATESASSLINNDPKTGQMLVYNVYDNADKMFNLCKKLPVGAVAWGLGSKGDIPVERLVRDFKSEISEKFDNGDYSVEDCVSAFKKFIFGDTYEEVFKKLSI